MWLLLLLLLPTSADSRLRSGQANETKWFLDSLQGSLRALKENLQECADLLAPMGPGSTLVLSSPRSESVKGFVTRVGTRIVKGVYIGFIFIFIFILELIC